MGYSVRHDLEQFAEQRRRITEVLGTLPPGSPKRGRLIDALAQADAYKDGYFEIAASQAMTDYAQAAINQTTALLAWADQA